MAGIFICIKDSVFIDPACGTAGFLISAYNYIRRENRDEDGNTTLNAEDMNRIIRNFAGYDISPDMVRLSRVNLYLHGFTAPNSELNPVELLILKMPIIGMETYVGRL